MGGFGGVADRLNAYNVLRGDPSLITTDVERFLKVTSDELESVAHRYLAARPRVDVAVVGRKHAASGPQLDRRVVPASGTALGFRPPEPEILALPCGIPLWVFPRSDLPSVAGSIVIAGGGGAQPRKQAGLAQLTTAMLEEGTTSRTAAQIALAAESMGASVTAGCGWDASYVSFKCLKEHLSASLELAFDILCHPTFPEAEWGRVRGQALAALKAERDHAESRAYRALLRLLYSREHPYQHPLAGSEESVAGFLRPDLMEFHARFVLGGRATLIVAGDVEPHALAAELGRWLTSWNGGADDSCADPPAPGSGHARLILIDRPGAPQAVIRAGHVGLARSDLAYEAMLIVNQVLGGQFSSRLNGKLREERGVTYGVRSSFDCRRHPGPFLISASVQNDRLAETLGEIHQELTALVGARPPDQVEVDDARRSLIEGQVRQFETPNAVVNRFGTLAAYGLPVDHDAGFAERLAAIDLDALAALASREVHPERLVAVVVGDAARILDELKRVNWAAVEIAGEEVDLVD
jgi:predicted Zn-dependent peptidase